MAHMWTHGRKSLIRLLNQKTKTNLNLFKFRNGSKRTKFLILCLETVCISRNMLRNWRRYCDFWSKKKRSLSKTWTRFGSRSWANTKPSRKMCMICSANSHGTSIPSNSIIYSVASKYEINPQTFFSNNLKLNCKKKIKNQS